MPRLAVALTFVLFVAACGGSNETAAGDTSQKEISSSLGRLEGEWVLVEFKPADQLEPMFSALLAAQMGQLKLKLRSGTMTIEGVGVSAQRTYQITQAAADGFAAVMTDTQGGQYRVIGAFQGKELAFESQTDPWRGTGRLRRAH